MWNPRYLSRIDGRMIVVIILLMLISLVVISAYTTNSLDLDDDSFFTPQVRKQIKAFLIGWTVFFFFVSFDYNKLREWSWILYVLTLLALIGLFFTDSIQRVHRWYRIPFLGNSFQPSEYAKLSVVITLSWFLEFRKTRSQQWSTAILGGLITGIPALLILKQPDLGTACVLFPITLVMFYFGDLHSWVVRTMTICGGIILAIVLLIFLGIVSYQELRPYTTPFLKEYQFDRLNPHTHHQKAAVTAIGMGGVTGAGWRKSEYSSAGWLPEPYTDSVFPAFGETFGLIGEVLLIALYYCLIHFSFQVTAAAKDHFGRLLSAGITVYLAVHIIFNISMMCGVFPITGVPLVLITCGGSSVLVTMVALGILQSIYSRRFMF